MCRRDSRFTERKVIHLDAHLRRLANSAAGLSLTLPCPIEEIRDIVLAVAKAGDEPCLLYTSRCV